MKLWGGSTQADFRVMLCGYIDLNAIDGSAFFLASVASMLSREPGVHVTLVSACKIRTHQVVDELVGVENVSLVDPFRSPNYAFLDFVAGKQNMSRRQYAEILSYEWRGGNFDAALLRDTETAIHLLELEPEIGSKLTVYVTGLTSLSEEIPESLAADLRVLRESGCRLLVQTEEMKERLESILDIDVKVGVLPPHVPDAGSLSTRPYSDKIGSLRMVYSGKFFRAWNIDKLVVAVKALRADGVPVSLDVVGNYFQRGKENEMFRASVKYLLESSEGVRWHGGVPRDESRRLLASGHVASSWRSQELDDSSEFSTKVLEAGALGVPSIVNPSRVNLRVIGEEYPLYADTSARFYELTRELVKTPSLLQDASEMLKQVADAHSYSKVSPQLLTFLGNEKKDEFDKFEYSVPFLEVSDIDSLPFEDSDKVEFQLNGQWLRVRRSNASYAMSSEQALHDVKMKYAFYASVEAQRARLHSEGCSANDQFDVEPRENNSEYEQRVLSLSSRNAQLEAELNALKEELSNAQARAESVSERLNNLRNSKLGKLQRKLWKMRS